MEEEPLSRQPLVEEGSEVDHSELATINQTNRMLLEEEIPHSEVEEMPSEGLFSLASEELLLEWGETLAPLEELEEPLENLNRLETLGANPRLKEPGSDNPRLKELVSDNHKIKGQGLELVGEIMLLAGVKLEVLILAIKLNPILLEHLLEGILPVHSAQPTRIHLEEEAQPLEPGLELQELPSEETQEPVLEVETLEPGLEETLELPSEETQEPVLQEIQEVLSEVLSEEIQEQQEVLSEQIQEVQEQQEVLSEQIIQQEHLDKSQQLAGLQITVLLPSGIKEELVLEEAQV